jgi:hypothetical protein
MINHAPVTLPSDPVRSAEAARRLRYLCRWLAIIGTKV